LKKKFSVHNLEYRSQYSALNNSLFSITGWWKWRYLHFWTPCA